MPIRSPQSHGTRAVVLSASPVWKRICSMGMMVMNENTFSTADSMLNTTVSTRYFLYGGTKRRNTCRNSFICKALHVTFGGKDNIKIRLGEVIWWDFAVMGLWGYEVMRLRGCFCVSPP